MMMRYLDMNIFMEAQLFLVAFENANSFPPNY